MSMAKLDRDELLKAVEFFGVEVDKESSDATLREALKADGIDYRQYKKFLVPDEEQDGDQVVPAAAVPPSEPVVEKVPVRHLVKMERRNPIFEIGKYRWTRKHPFQLVDDEDIDYVVRRHAGFSLATPSEAREFYS